MVGLFLFFYLVYTVFFDVGVTTYKTPSRDPVAVGIENIGRSTLELAQSSVATLSAVTKPYRSIVGDILAKVASLIPQGEY